MSFLFSGVFWGLILVLLGASIIINIVFHVHIPLFRIIVALILVYFGFKVLFGGNYCRAGRSDSTKVVFGESTIKAGSVNSGEYSTIFGKSTIDATDSTITDLNKKFDINTVFGETVLYVSKSVPIKIRASAAFGSAQFPNGTTISFGDYTYKTAAWQDSSGGREIKADVVFGSLRVVER